MNILELYIYQELKKSGFTYKYYEDPSNYVKGMSFLYNGKVWIFGGKFYGKRGELPEEIKNGIWLPDESYFLSWLEENDFSFLIKYDTLYRVEATDLLTSAQYRANGANLSQALAYLITNICKKSIRPYDTKEIERYEIIDDDDE